MEKSEAAKVALCTLGAFWGGKKKKKRKRFLDFADTVRSCDITQEWSRQRGREALWGWSIWQSIKAVCLLQVFWFWCDSADTPVELTMLHLSAQSGQTFLYGRFFTWSVMPLERVLIWQDVRKRAQNTALTISSQAWCLQKRLAAFYRLSSILVAWLMVWLSSHTQLVSSGLKSPLATQHFCTRPF